MQESKTGILAQNAQSNAPRQRRKLRLRWWAALSIIPLFGIITAFGIAPQTAHLDVPVATVIEDIALPLENLPSTVNGASAREAVWHIDQVRRDDTFSTLLQRLNIRNPDAIEFLRTSADAQALASQLSPGHTLLVKTSEQGELLSLQYQTGATSALSVTKTATGYRAEEHAMLLETSTIAKSARIRSSLFAATDEADIPDRIAMQIADIFSSELDFHLDLRIGDQFSVLYEANYYNGELIKTGRVLAAEFVNQGQVHRAVLYRDPSGHEGYYTPQGKNVHRPFLRSPLEFSRISSGFTLARLHPILKTWRAHKGIDYAAPIGTRVKAAADATVDFAGKQAGYGNVVTLRHKGGITTVYGHLSRIAPGVRKGASLAQGDTIGFVGMSGLATGPHLHYEFRINGQHRDPLKVALPDATPVPGIYQSHFAHNIQELTTQLNLLHNTNTASLE